MIFVSDSTLKLVAFADPNLTALASVKPVPMIVTGVPPIAGL